MEEFFEAWMETVAAALTRRIGGVLHVGHKREPIAPLVWNSPYVGSQRYLLPDLALERLSARGEKETISFDAKYKGHWADLNHTVGRLDEELREQHSADMLQVLAYSTLSEASKITSCLVTLPKAYVGVIEKTRHALSSGCSQCRKKNCQLGADGHSHGV